MTRCLACITTPYHTLHPLPHATLYVPPSLSPLPSEQLDDLLKDSEAIREAREEGRTPDALLPIGAADDYRAPVKEKPIDLGIVSFLLGTSFFPLSGPKVMAWLLWSSYSFVWLVLWGGFFFFLFGFFLSVCFPIKLLTSFHPHPPSTHARRHSPPPRATSAVVFPIAFTGRCFRNSS